jgi:hypothetical protein
MVVEHAASLRLVTNPHRCGRSGSDGHGAVEDYSPAFRSANLVTPDGFSDLSGEPGSLPFPCYAEAKPNAKPIDTGEVRSRCTILTGVSNTKRPERLNSGRSGARSS